MGDLACSIAEGLLAARAAGALATERGRELDAHLETCPACREFARDLEAPALADALAGVDIERDFAELTVVESQNYIRGQVIGRGGMGHIVRAHDRRLGRAVAIKELIDKRMQARFEREARLTAKLQHPAIVTVYEAGRWPSGEPFYAMKYVAGRPLDQVIAGMATLEERLGLLSNLTTVVEAIAYAHSERVIHRDLKPQNILIGPFGETVVIDWGLAKDLGEPATAATPFRGGGGAFTAAGAGTPAYMAPEQALGAKPDERVDVYALGATLHHVLAGEPPHVGVLPAATPRDLRAIIEKAMAQAKEDRYPTAAELAGELRRFQAGQLVAAYRYTRWERVARSLRRHRSTALVVLVALVGLAIMATVSVRRIVAERDRADSQRRGAEGLVDFMLGTLQDRLAPIGRLDVLAGVGKEVEHYYSSVSTDHETDPEVLRRRAAALRLLGQVDRAKGSHDDVRSEALRTVELCERLEQIAPAPEAADCAVRALTNLGSMESDRGNAGPAFAAYRRADARLDVALARYPGNLGLLKTRSTIAMFVAHEHTAESDVAGARSAYWRAIAILDQLLVENPDDRAIMRGLGLTHSELGDLEENDGRPAAALATYGAADAARDRLRTLEPGNVGYQVDWAESFGSAALAAAQLGDFALAVARVEPALAVLRKSAESDPQNQFWNMDVALFVGWLCELELDRGHLDRAAASCRESESKALQLLEKDPEYENAAQVLPYVDSLLATIALERGDVAGAREAAGKAVETAVTWSRKRPGATKWLDPLSTAYWRLASAERAAGSIGAALAAASTGFMLATTPRMDFSLEIDAARADTLIAEIEGDAGDREGAAVEFVRAQERLERAAARWPGVVELDERLAEAILGRAAVIEGGPGAQVETRSLRARARAILEPLAGRGALTHELYGLMAQARR